MQTRPTPVHAIQMLNNADRFIQITQAIGTFVVEAFANQLSILFIINLDRPILANFSDSIHEETY